MEAEATGHVAGGNGPPDLSGAVEKLEGGSDLRLKARAAPVYARDTGRCGLPRARLEQALIRWPKGRHTLSVHSRRARPCHIRGKTKANRQREIPRGDFCAGPEAHQGPTLTLPAGGEGIPLRLASASAPTLSEHRPLPVNGEGRGGALLPQ